MSGRPDSEHAQAIVRLVIASLLLSYLGWLKIGEQGTNVDLTLAVMAGEAIVAAAIMVAILLKPGVSHVRRWIGMITDYATLATLMLLKPAELSPLYVIILWVTIGNGMRYGSRYLISASVLASLAFLSVVAFSSYWWQQPFLAGGLLLGLFAIPLYLSSLLRDLHRVTEEAKRANEAKSRFLASMSHEFRSPLNGIIGMSELLRNMKLNAEQRECAEVIHASAHTLLFLVDDVLDISAIEAGKLKRKDADFELPDVLKRVQQMLQPQADAKSLKLSVAADERVPSSLHGDGAYLTQILLNLTHNAIKFTSTGSVALQVSLLEEGTAGARLRFSVRDTGIGIPDEHKQRIFQAFEQVDSGPSRRFGGTGLGTTIAQTLARLMGGELGLDDNPGGGSHFWADIPFEVRVEQVAEQHGLQAGGKVVAFDDPFVRHRARVRNLRILVADDQHANRRVLVRILEKAGHAVLTATNGDEALDRFEGGGIDLAILDMHMPQVSGIDVIKHLRYMQAGTARTPVIVLSADATPQAAEQARAAGARAFLTKPVAVARLLETIADAVKAQVDPQEAKAVGDLVEPSAPRSELLEELAEMGLGEEFLVSFVDQCLKDAASCLVRLGDDGRRRDWNDFRDGAHALKGISQNLGAWVIAERCQQIMRASDEFLVRDHGRLVEELGTQLHVAVQQSKREVERILRNQPAGDTGRGGGAGPEAS
ncbi:response regulator [Luteimonas marina]|uniref:Sensory/regulatory protein RpfC n=1 Tax=Luteimonas marina TaxID=488485 RepID=A0A5C5UC10_9GAMM|nr:response regulator [Luteimonas marina]TWT23506.1 response regulator [Luteimonas marina]